MSMTKKEQAAFAELQEQLRIAKAFRFTDAVEPDVPIPETFGELSKGWLYNAYISSPRVERACSSAVGHSFGSDDKTDSQKPKRLYSSKLLALRALRHDIERQLAKVLADIDRSIDSSRD